MKFTNTIRPASFSQPEPKPKLVDQRGQELIALRDCGSLEQHFWWVVTRVREFEIGIDSAGRLSQCGVPMPQNHLMCLLKKDFSKAFPGLSHKTMAVVLKCAVDKLTREALKQLDRGEDGWDPTQESPDEQTPIGCSGNPVR